MHNHSALDGGALFVLHFPFASLCHLLTVRKVCQAFITVPNKYCLFCVKKTEHLQINNV